jgi:uncharacterized protein (DUF2062 family)
MPEAFPRAFPEAFPGLNLLSAMITPAVLISAAGTLIFSTSTRLGRIVDRVRVLSRTMEEIFSGQIRDFVEERRAELERQLRYYAKRSDLLQRALNAFYIALGIFVATTIAIGLTPFIPLISWLPSSLGIAGTVWLFYGSVLLIRETRYAVLSVNAEMRFVLQLAPLYEARLGIVPEAAKPERRSGLERLMRLFQRGGEERD